MVPELVDIGGDLLSMVGEYRVPLKLELQGGERAMLDLAVTTT